MEFDIKNEGIPTEWPNKYIKDKAFAIRKMIMKPIYLQLI